MCVGNYVIVYRIYTGYTKLCIVRAKGQVVCCTTCNYLRSKSKGTINVVFPVFPVCMLACAKVI